MVTYKQCSKAFDIIRANEKKYDIAHFTVDDHSFICGLAKPRPEKYVKEYMFTNKEKCVLESYGHGLYTLTNGTKGGLIMYILCDYGKNKKMPLIEDDEEEPWYLIYLAFEGRTPKKKTVIADN